MISAAHITLLAVASFIPPVTAVPVPTLQPLLLIAAFAASKAVCQSSITKATRAFIPEATASLIWLICFLLPELPSMVIALSRSEVIC